MNTPPWVRSSYCDSAGLDCVAVAACPDPAPSVWVRDTKVPLGRPIVVEPRTWSRFVDSIQRSTPADLP
ncbi:DUF397 domain-containing protein [Streptomyces sp. NPDC002589]|uniref:DUF397 domain-containing protein n=1 Tax=Streptomyces sp. NPDC002589 TaxID=3154420 RepID=UPI003316AE8D